MKVDLIQILVKLFAPYQVNVNVLKKPYHQLEFYNFELRSMNIDLKKHIQQFIKNIPMNTLFIVKDYLSVEYALFILPESYDCVVIGPFRYGKYFSFDVSKYDFNQEMVQELKGYVFNVPYVEESLITVNLGSIVSTIYPKNKFEIKYYVENQPLNIIPKSISLAKKHKDKANSMKDLEKRYEIENQIMQAVSKGDATLATILMKKMMSPDMASRFVFSLHQQKNSIIILNTLLRKAIEQGNVHPYYIDEISTRYAQKMELITSEQDFMEMMSSMIHEYCDYVHRYSNQQYSSLIQQSIHYINMNLDKEITLDELSKIVNVNSAYLSNQFKIETGTTIINYINHQKMKHACYLLKNTQMNVSRIAERVGIYDSNYFSRLFKKYIGNTPRDYRKSSM